MNSSIPGGHITGHFASYEIQTNRNEREHRGIKGRHELRPDFKS
jgi:hypothetical protein